MGRLPATWADRPVVSREPYTVSGELVIEQNQRGVLFPEATFQNGVDKPFEIHRVIPRLWALTSENAFLPAQPEQSFLAGMVRVSFVDTAFDLKMNKVPVLLDTLLKGTSERTWEFADPHTITRANGIQITVDTLPFALIDNFARLRIGITFQGFLLVVAPPLGNR